VTELESQSQPSPRVSTVAVPMETHQELREWLAERSQFEPSGNFMVEICSL